VAAAVRFRRTTAFLACLTAVALAWLQGDPQVACVAVASLSFFTHAAGVGVAVLHADIDYSRSEALRVVGSVLGLLGTVILVGFGFRDAGSMLIAVYAGMAISNVLLALSVREEASRGASSLDYRSFRNESLALGIGGVVRQAYYSANPVLARALAGDVAGARFAPAYRLTGFSILVSVYAGAAALPALVRLRSSSPEAHRRFVARWTLGLALLGAAIAGALYVFRVPILRLLFGEEYVDSE
jgi:O-antigen/teichoic acid export membrane protein